MAGMVHKTKFDSSMIASSFSKTEILQQKIKLSKIKLCWCGYRKLES